MVEINNRVKRKKEDLSVSKRKKQINFYFKLRLLT